MSVAAPRIGNGAIVTTCELLKAIRTNAELESMLLEYGLGEQVLPGGSIASTLLALMRFTTSNPDHTVHTDRGERLLAAVLIDEAIRVAGEKAPSEQWDKLGRYLAVDGYALLKDVEEGMFSDRVRISGFTTTMPADAHLAESSSELELLLSSDGFEVARRHLASARDNMTQGDWEASNSQCRTFLEALTDAIAQRLYPEESAQRQGGLQKRQLLAEKGFLSREKHEFGDGNAQTFLPGLAKLLHPDGAHPGMTTPHDAMFRFQLVNITGRWLMKRLESVERALGDPE